MRRRYNVTCRVGEECNPNNKRKILIVFDEMIADMLNNKKHNPIVLNYSLEEEN